MSFCRASPLLHALNFDINVKPSESHTFEVHLTDRILTDSALDKFDTNVIDRNAVARLKYVTVHVGYYTEQLSIERFVKEVNYLMCEFLVGHWEHQMPLVFGLKSREIFEINFKHVGNLSFSLTGGSELMIKLLRIVDQGGYSVLAQLLKLTKALCKRRYKKKNDTGAGNKKVVEVFPVQFFDVNEFSSNATISSS